MSKLLKKDLLREDNSYQISQLGAFISAYNADQAIGIANKRWKTCVMAGPLLSGTLRNAFSYENVDAADLSISLEIPLDYIKGIHNLIITKIKIGIEDAAANDYLDRIRMIAWSDYDSVTVLLDENNGGAGWKTPQEVIIDHSDKTIGGNYERVHIFINGVCTNPLAFGISFVQVEYYYD